MKRTIRLATANDSDEILSIYAPYVATAVTFETDIPSNGDFASRVSGILRTYPYLVCVENGSIIGYSYASKHRERAAYRYDVETSVYVKRGCHSKGVGTSLYNRLFDILKKQGFYNAYAGITLPNEKSQGLHSKLGFLPVGIYHRVGYKQGKWHDVLWLEKAICDHCIEPRDVKPIADIGWTEEITDLL